MHVYAKCWVTSVAVALGVLTLLTASALAAPPLRVADTERVNLAPGGVQVTGGDSHWARITET